MRYTFRSAVRAFSAPFLIFSELGFSVAVFALSLQQARAFLIVAGLIYMLLMITPRLLYRFTRLKNVVQKDVIHLVEILGCCMAILNGLGALSFYRTLAYYDTAVHFIGALGTGMIVALFLGAGFKTTQQYTLARLRFFSILITICFLFLWEAFEYVGDSLFNTSMLGQDGEPYDTVYDIIAGSIAMLLLYAVNRSIIHRYFYGKYKKIKRQRRFKRSRNSSALS